MKKIEFKDLNPQQQDFLQKTYKDIDILRKFANKLNAGVLEHLFEKRMAEHLMEKFVKCNRDIFCFLNNLDSDNKEIIITNLYGNEEFKKIIGID